MTVHRCRNAGVTEPRALPSRPHFLASEGTDAKPCPRGGKMGSYKRDPALIKKHIRVVGSKKMGKTAFNWRQWHYRISRKNEI